MITYIIPIGDVPQPTIRKVKIPKVAPEINFPAKVTGTVPNHCMRKTVQKMIPLEVSASITSP